jgi:hypothetical protein
MTSNTVQIRIINPSIRGEREGGTRFKKQIPLKRRLALMILQMIAGESRYGRGYNRALKALS